MKKITKIREDICHLKHQIPTYVNQYMEELDPLVKSELDYFVNSLDTVLLNLDCAEVSDNFDECIDLLWGTTLCMPSDSPILHSMLTILDKFTEVHDVQ